MTRPDQPALTELFSEVTTQLQVLMRKEVELARVETKEQLSQAAKGGAAIGAAGALAFVALILLASAGAWGLAEVTAPGWAFLAVGVALLAAAGAVFSLGRRKVAQLDPVPRQTVMTVKEDVETAKDSLQRGVSEPAPYAPWPSEPWRS